MAVEKKFIKTALSDYHLKRFLRFALEKAGVSSIVIQKTPIATRITITVKKPGMVVGKKGSAIKELYRMLQEKFGIENPQLEILEVQQPNLDAYLVAERIGKQVELRPRVKPIMRFALNDIMSAGALGAEIRVAGKVVGKGGKSKTLSVRSGFLKKSGDLMKKVRVGFYTAYLKAGAIGITVKIVPPGTVFPDKIVIAPREAEPVVETQAVVEPEPAVEETPAAVEEKTAEAPAEKPKRPRKKTVKKEKKEKDLAGGEIVVSDAEEEADEEIVEEAKEEVAEEKK